MEPVEIDIQMKQNVTEESKKATEGLNDINAATDKTNAAMGSIANTGKQAVAAAKEAVQEQVNVVKQIEADIKNIEKQLVTAAPGNAKSAMIEELQSAKQALSEEKAALGEYSAKVDEAAQSNVRLRTQVMNAKQALDEMAQAGLRESNPEAYKAAQVELGNLQSRMNAANKQAKVLGDPQGGMHAVTQTVTGMSGAFTAATGVMSLFAGENADLQKIQMRLQAVMAITIGLTQTAEMLNTNSYFKLRILIPAKEMLAASELKVAAAMGISTVAAQALMATLTLGLTLAIGAAIYMYEKWSSAQEKAKSKAKELADFQSKLQEDISSGYALEESKIQSLKASLNSENVSRDKKLEIIRELKNIIPGYTAQLDSEGNVIRQNKKAIDEYMISLEKSLKFHAAEKELESIYEKKYNLEKLVLPENQQGGQFSIKKSTQTPEEKLKKSISDAAKVGMKLLDDQASLIEKHIEDGGLFDDKNVKKDKVAKVAKEQYNAAEALQKLLLDINDKTSTLLIKQQEDGLQKRLDEIDHEKEEEVRKVTEKETAIVEAYNKNHRTEKGFKPLSTKPENLQSSLTKIDPKDTKSINDALLALDKSYQSKSLEATEQWGQKMLDLAGELADKRVKIEDDWNKKINLIDTQAKFLDTEASTETDPAIKKKYQDEAAYLRTGMEADKTERNKRVSEVSMSYIKETEGYKLATDQQLNLGKKLNDELINKIKERVAAEVAAGKLTKEDASTILTTVDKSQAKKVSGSLVDLIDSYSKLKKAKEDLATAQKNGDSDGIIKSTEAVENYTKANELSFQKMQKGFSEASSYANQAVGLLNAISTSDGDAASSAAKSIGAVMNIADAAMQGYAQGGPIGAAVGLITSTLTQVFQAEKVHQAALAAIAKAKLDTQKEYNDLLMKQNNLLKSSESIFGTDAYGKANAYAAQMEAYSKALHSTDYTVKKSNSPFAYLLPEVREYTGAIASLNNATVQTGSHKTGLFGWGGEKADYSSLLGQYPKLIDAQGNLNTEMAQSILDNQKLDDTSKAALQSALDYTKDYEEALSNLKSYLNSVFGSLGDDLMTTIVDNLNDSKAALDDFGDYVGKAVQKMLKDLAYSIFFAKMFNDLSDNLTKIYSNASLTDADKEAQASDAIGTFYGGLDTKIAAAAKFYNDTAAAFEAKTGIDMTSDTARTGTSKGIATASQDSIDELTGGVYAIRLSIADIRNFTKEQLLIEQTITNQLLQLIENTSYCKLLENINRTFNDLNLKGIKIRV